MRAAFSSTPSVVGLFPFHTAGHRIGGRVGSFSRHWPGVRAVKKSGSGKQHHESKRLRAVQLYRNGYSEAEISSPLSVPQSTLNRWIGAARQIDPQTEMEHLQGAQGRKVGERFVKWGPVAEQVTVFSQDEVTGKVTMGPGVLAAAGSKRRIEEELFRQQLASGQYVSPRYNLPLLMKLHLVDGFGYIQTAKEYFFATKRHVSPSTVRRLVKDMTVEWHDDEGKRAMADLFTGKAAYEEQLRNRAKMFTAQAAEEQQPKPSRRGIPTPPAVPRHPIKRMWLEKSLRSADPKPGQADPVSIGEAGADRPA